MSNFKIETDADGIALVTWDMADRSMNVITMDVIAELGAVVEKIANDAAIKGAVITSGKQAFCGGADLTMLDRMADIFATMVKTQGEQAAAGQLYEESRKLSLLYRRIETCGKPWVCALNGTAMGGGFELALACHHRVAADDAKTRLGLPEIKIGLFPGAGGTQRVARMLQPADALQFLLKGDQLKVDRAKAMKLVDNVVPAPELIKTAKDWIMGAGIAEVSAAAGLEVVLVDRDQDTADKGKAGLQKALSDRVMKGRMKGAERDELLGRITPTPDYAALKDCDLVIEAVFEDRKVKSDVIAKIQAVIGDNAIFASNTSTLPISSLASEFKDPARFIRIHFFSPVDRMMLVEIILGKQTGDKALAAALDYVRAIRKTPIVVNDSRGFYTSRVVGTYIRECHLMLTEGVPAAMIENVGRMGGMAVGPLSLNDEVAVRVGRENLENNHTHLAGQVNEPQQKKLLPEMVGKRGRVRR